MKNQISCGIDFGTSNSTCAVFNTDNVALVPLEKENPVLPSALFFSRDNEIFYGKEAINAYVEGEEGRLLRGLKSVLGTSLMSERTVIGRKSMTFEAILSVYIAHLKHKAEVLLGADLKNIVMGRPVHFHDNDEAADRRSEDVLKKIAKRNGFKNIEFQYEPIAAAYAHERKITKETLALVVDLGGGTSDFTIIRLSPERANKHDRKDDILATSGIRVGGTTFDKALSLASFMPDLGLGSSYYSDFDDNQILPVPSRPYHNLSEWPLIYQGQSPKAIRETKSLLRTALEPEKLRNLLYIQEKSLGHYFLQMVEKAKIALSDKDVYNTDFSTLDIALRTLTTRDTFIHSITPLIERIQGCLDECLTLSGCSCEDINLVILTGGSSELPIINEMVSSKFKRASFSKDDKFGSVGRGLAYNAAQIYKRL